MDPEFARANLVHEYPISIFTSRFQELSHKSDQSANLLLQLKFAHAYAENLILTLQSCHLNLTNSAKSYSTERAKACKFIVSKFLELMGDVLNNKESLSNSNYSRSLDWYRRAFEFYPKSASAVGKLAQLTSDENCLEKLYYFSLYIGNSDDIKDDCIRMNALLRRSTFDRNLENPTASDHWISVSMALYGYLSALKMKVDTEQMKANVYFCISSVGLVQMQDIEQIGKLIIIFIVLISSLEEQFLSVAEISAKKLIREKQSIGIMYLLALAMRQQEFAVESDDPNSTEAVLKVLSPFSLWLILNTKLLRTSNTVAYSIDKLFSEVLHKWISSLVKLSNLLAPRAIMTMDRVEYLDIDRHLLGLRHYGLTFENIDAELPNANAITVLSSRLVRLAYFISQSEELSLICCYPNTTSMVFKERVHDLQEKMIKNMTILATERLKDQVKDLETKLATFEQLKTDIYIVYTDILINRLDLVRDCLKAEQARMVISIEGIFI